MSKFRLIPYAAMTAAGLLAASGAANAQSMRDINQQQDNQQDRIERGIYGGQISRSEANRLEQGERAIDSAQRRAAADGHVTGQERARIDRMTDLQGREINQQSHDRQQAWDHGQGWGRTDGRPYNGWNDRDGRGGAANGQSMREINQSQDSQQNRIERGVYNGQITRSEASRLEQGERAIDSAQRRAEADGRVTGQERARIDRMTDLQGREIKQQSHDRQQAWDQGQGWGRTDGRPSNGWNDRDGRGGAANGPSMREINQSQDSQQNRIERGVYNGQITRSEASRLEQGERAIDSAQRRAEADGRVTGQERARIDRMTDLQGREIKQQSHDRQQAWDQGQGWGRTDGRPSNGWNDRDGSGRQAGWDRNGGNNASNGWNRGNGGSNQNGNGTGAGTGTTAGSGHTWGGNNGGGHRGGAGMTTPPTRATGGTAVASNTGNRNWGNWGGQTRQVSATSSMSAPTRNYATANTGARSGGGRSFGGGGGGGGGRR